MAARSKVGTTADGFTLVELLTVLAIVSILIAVGGASYSHFMNKARSVEAEVALSEINRLEQVYFASTGSYTNNIEELGFRPLQPLKYYALSVEVVGQQGYAAFRALAVPVSGPGTGQTFSVVQYANPASSGSNGSGTPSASSGFAFGGEGWSDEGIIPLDEGPSQKGGIGKVVQHQKPAAPPAPASK